MEGWKSFPSLSFLSQAENYVPFISPKLVSPREKSLPKPSLILIQKNFKTLRDQLHSHSHSLSLSHTRGSGRPEGSAGQGRPAMARRPAMGGGRPWARRPAMGRGRPVEQGEGVPKVFFLLLYFLANFDGISLDLSVYWLISNENL